jgi:hypothetical protein
MPAISYKYDPSTLDTLLEKPDTVRATWALTHAPELALEIERRRFDAAEDMARAVLEERTVEVIAQATVFYVRLDAALIQALLLVEVCKSLESAMRALDLTGVYREVRKTIDVLTLIRRRLGEADKVYRVG